MSKTIKIWVIIASSLIVLGLSIFVMIMTIYGWDFSKLSTVKYETNIYEVTEDFNNLTINTDTAYINFVSSDNAECKVVCYEEKSAKHSVVVENNTLLINLNNEKKWYEYIGISFNSPKITIYLPDNEFGTLIIKESTGDIEIPQNFIFEGIDISVSTGNVKSSADALECIKIKTTTGDILLENASAGALNLSVSTGKVNLSSIKCKGDIKLSVTTGDTTLNDTTCENLTSTGGTGDITLNNIIATENFSIERDTGNVKFDGCDAAEIFTKTNTGNVSGSLLTNKVFITQTDTGIINVPKTTNGGKCEIVTDTGDIKINIQK